MISKTDKEYILQLAEKQEDGIEYRYNCFICGDNRKRLYIKKNLTKVYVHCFNGGCKLQVRGLVLSIYRDYKDLIDKDVKLNTKQVNNLNLHRKLPQKAVNYLLKYLDKNTIENLNNKGIILYEYELDRLMFKCRGGYTGRSLDSKPKWIKYGAEYFIIGNEYLKTNNKIVLVEDCISAIKTSKSARCCTMALIGIQIPLKLKHRIIAQNMASERHIVIWLDKDSAGIKGMLKVKRELEAFLKCSVVYKPEPKLCSEREIKEALI
jgi:hypothetical protein